MFPLTFPKNTTIYHYDIEILSDRLKKDEKRDFFRDFCKQNKMLFKDSTGRYGFAYDGEKNVYTIEKLPINKRWFGKVRRFSVTLLLNQCIEVRLEGRRRQSRAARGG